MRSRFILSATGLTLAFAMAAGWMQPSQINAQETATQEQAAQEASVLAITPEPVNAEWWTNRHQAKLDQIKADADIDLVLLGDSITHGWEGSGKTVFDEFFAKRKPLNIGFSGDRTEHVLWRLDHGAIDGISPKLVVMMIGTNNTGHRQDKPENTALGISLILAQLQRKLPEAKILVLGVFPRDATVDGKLRKINDKVNQIIAQMADNKDVFYLNINDKFLEADGALSKEVMPDLLHPQEQGYKLWADAIEPLVSKLMGQ